MVDLPQSFAVHGCALKDGQKLRHAHPLVVNVPGEGPELAGHMHHLPAQEGGVLQGHLQNGLDVCRVQIPDHLLYLLSQHDLWQCQLDSIGINLQGYAAAKAGGKDG